MFKVHRVFSSPPTFALKRQQQFQRWCASRTAHVAFGSNLGDRAGNIHRAIDSLNQIGSVTKTSFLYESLPMYNTDQPSFLNGVVELQLSSKMTPLLLLNSLKQIEAELGRDISNPMASHNNPRPIDLDIILFDQLVYNDVQNNLNIPHPRLAERQFVLKPLLDIHPNMSLPAHKDKNMKVKDIYLDLVNKEGDVGLVQVTPLLNGQLLKWGQRTLLMGVLNITPDSFSDGGKFTNIDNALKQAEKFVNHGFDIIDIGGQSTRPGAEQVPAEEELERVIPVIQRIVKEYPEIPISLDTFYSKVAREGIENGIQIINDITGCKHDEAGMLNLINEYNIPMILMHIRGTPKTMKQYTSYKNEEELYKEVADEIINQSIFKQLRLKWNVIADCGIGFAKDFRQNIILMKQSQQFKQYIGNYPCLLGISRKSWIKSIHMNNMKIPPPSLHDMNMNNKDWMTTGAIIHSICNGGVDIIRIHEPSIAYAVHACDFLNSFKV